jgi:transposase InsO family protein
LVFVSPYWFRQRLQLDSDTSSVRSTCLCAIKDVFSNRIVGWSMDDRMTARLVVAAIETAVARRGEVAGRILHSDRGSQTGPARCSGP